MFVTFHFYLILQGLFILIFHVLRKRWLVDLHILNFKLDAQECLPHFPYILKMDLHCGFLLVCVQVIGKIKRHVKRCITCVAGGAKENHKSVTNSSVKYLYTYCSVVSLNRLKFTYYLQHSGLS